DVERERVPEELWKSKIVRIGDSSGHASANARAIGNRLRDDADVGDVGLAKSVDDGGKDAEGDRFIAAKENAVPIAFELGLGFGAKFVRVDGAVAEVDELFLVDADDNLLFGDFADGLRFRNVEFDAGLQDRRGDHEDDQQHEDDVDERDHV